MKFMFWIVVLINKASIIQERCRVTAISAWHGSIMVVHVIFVPARTRDLHLYSCNFNSFTRAGSDAHNIDVTYVIVMSDRQTTSFNGSQSRGNLPETA